MEDTVNIILGIGLAVLLGIAIMLYQRRKRNQHWEGVVLKIQRSLHRNDQDDPGTYMMKIVYRKPNGWKGKLRLDEYEYRQMYLNLKPGDKLVKEVGQDYPRVEPA